jgi:peptidoglycan hydrolase-like protein with peptidoglycan-binding domain
MPQLQRRSQTPRVAIAVAALVGLAACVVALVTLTGTTKPTTAGAPAVNTAPIERRDLVVRDTEDGTLGYAGSRTVLSRISGTITWLPSGGRVVRRGERLFSVDDRPVVLFYGTQPAYRRLAAGVADGEDVRQLEENLAALGYDPGGAMAVDGHYSDTTAAIVKRWQRDLGLRATGAVELGRVVYLPGERRVGQLKVTLGSTGGGGSPSGGNGSSAATEIMETTSPRRLVTVKLDATKQAVAAVGARVTITLPDGSATGGRITGVGKVAQKSSSDNGGGGGGGGGGQGTATIPVSVALTGQRRVTSLDQAPVTVGFAKERRRRALSVPVTALVATAGGRYAVDVVQGARHRRVPVTPGIFATGYVEISGAGLAAGQRVVDAQ